MTWVRAWQYSSGQGTAGLQHRPCPTLMPSSGHGAVIRGSYGFKPASLWHSVLAMVGSSSRVVRAWPWSHWAS